MLSKRMAAVAIHKTPWGANMKNEQILTRADGSQVKIVAELFTSPSVDFSIGNYVLFRPNAESKWSLCGDRPHPDHRSMSVDEYVKHGRPEMLQVASIAEILKVNRDLRLQFEALH